MWFGSAYISELDDRWRSCDVMYISKIAATASQIYFRFQFWWCITFKNVQIYPHTKFRTHSSIHGWLRCYYFRFLKNKWRPVAARGYLLPGANVCVTIPTIRSVCNQVFFRISDMGCEPEPIVGGPRLFAPLTLPPLLSFPPIPRPFPSSSLEVGSFKSS